MYTPIHYRFEVPLERLKQMLKYSDTTVIKMEPEFPNQKSFNVIENDEVIYHVLFTGRVDEWKIVLLNRDNPLVANVRMYGQVVDLFSVTNLNENQSYRIEYGTLQEPLGIVSALPHWGYLK